MTDLAPWQARVDEHLEHFLALGDTPDTLAAAMHYAVMAGGKRVRPCLVYLATRAAGGKADAADATACAIEMIHAYSLAHDDLPAMDDDELRRGNPTCHRQFDEATAILAGDALQARAFEIVADDQSLDENQRLAIVARLAAAAGPAGMVGGQIIDLASEDLEIDDATLIDMHQRKTGALIAASVICGGICANATPALTRSLGDFGYSLGLAFQVRDDILDETGDTERMGKQQGADKHRRKSTFVSLYGLDGATEKLEALRNTALTALAPLGSAGVELAGITDFITARDH